MLEVDLESVLQWIERNHLLMNVAKTQMMVLSRKRKKRQAEQVRVTLCGVEIAKRESVKYLGVLVDRELSWMDHVRKVRIKSLNALGMIRRIRSCLPVIMHKENTLQCFGSTTLRLLQCCMALVWNYLEPET